VMCLEDWCKVSWFGMLDDERELLIAQFRLSVGNICITGRLEQTH